MSQQKQRGLDEFDPIGDMRKAYSILMFLAAVWGLPVSALLTKPPWGSRFWGFHANLGMVLLLIVCTTTQPSRFTWGLPWAVPVVWGTVALAAIGQSLEGAKLRKKGARVHSYYVGRSILPGDELRAKTIYEPALVMVAGAVMLLADVAVGGWMIGAGVCLGLVHSHWDAEEKARIRVMQDARIQAEYDGSLMREGRE